MNELLTFLDFLDSVFNEIDNRVNQNQGQKSNIPAKPYLSDKYVKEVVFNGNDTIVKFNDGTHTIAHCNNNDAFNKETGVMLCLLKKFAPFNTNREIEHLVNNATVTKRNVEKSQEVKVPEVLKTPEKVENRLSEDEIDSILETEFVDRLEAFLEDHGIENDFVDFWDGSINPARIWVETNEDVDNYRLVFETFINTDLATKEHLEDFKNLVREAFTNSEEDLNRILTLSTRYGVNSPVETNTNENMESALESTENTEDFDKKYHIHERIRHTLTGDKVSYRGKVGKKEFSRATKEELIEVIKEFIKTKDSLMK